MSCQVLPRRFSDTTLVLICAGALSAVPKCPLLASAEPPELVSYLDGPEKSQTPACMEYAIRQIGDKGYAPAVDTLVRHLGFRREPGPGERGEGGLCWSICTSGTRQR